MGVRRIPRPGTSSETTMTEKQFLNALGNGSEDVLQLVLDVLSEHSAPYCVIGGLAVNAYAEPVVSLDLDIVIAADEIDIVCKILEGRFRIERFAHSVNLSAGTSDLRIQLQTDPRYQGFIGRAAARSVLGYTMNVASVEDVLQGKIWAYSDSQRRTSKRQKDLADIARLVETYPRLREHLPEEIRARFD